MPFWRKRTLRERIIDRLEDWRDELGERATALRPATRGPRKRAKQQLRNGRKAATRTKHTLRAHSLRDRQLAQRQRDDAGATAALLGGVGFGALLGGLAVASRLGADSEPLDRSFDAEPQLWQWRGWRVVTYERGKGQPVLLIHSINAAASAYEVRQPFGRLSNDFHVYTYDLLGFGASERPPLSPSADLYIDLIADVLRDVVGEPAHVIATSLSAAHAIAAAARSPELFRSLTVVNPTGMLTQVGGQGLGGRLVEALLRSGFVGEALFNLLVSRPSLHYFQRKTYSDERYLTQALIEQNYLTAHQPNARFAPAAFVGGALACGVEEALRTLSVPTLALWGLRNGYQNIEAERTAFARANPDLDSRVFPEAGGLIYDELPERFDELVSGWITSHGPITLGGAQQETAG